MKERRFMRDQVYTAKLATLTYFYKTNRVTNQKELKVASGYILYNDAGEQELLYPIATDYDGVAKGTKFHTLLEKLVPDESQREKLIVDALSQCDTEDELMPLDAFLGGFYDVTVSLEFRTGLHRINLRRRTDNEFQHEKMYTTEFLQATRSYLDPDCFYED